MLYFIFLFMFNFISQCLVSLFNLVSFHLIIFRFIYFDFMLFFICSNLSHDILLIYFIPFCLIYFNFIYLIQLNLFLFNFISCFLIFCI